MTILSSIRLDTAETGIALTRKTTADPAKIADAAKQFESLLIAQMLKSVRESSEGWMGTGEDQAGESAMALAEEHVATAMSASGGLGLANLIIKGLTQRVADVEAKSAEANSAGPKTAGATDTKAEGAFHVMEQVRLHRWYVEQLMWKLGKKSSSQLLVLHFTTMPQENRFFRFRVKKPMVIFQKE